eukprot:653818-Rhodomonas_salina.1
MPHARSPRPTATLRLPRCAADLLLSKHKLAKVSWTAIQVKVMMQAHACFPSSRWDLGPARPGIWGSE